MIRRVKQVRTVARRRTSPNPPGAVSFRLMRQTHGSMICPHCGKLISVTEPQCPFCGARNPAQALDNARAGEITLSEAELAAVENDIAKVQLALRNKGGAGDDSQQLAAANILYSRKRETRPAIEVLNTLTRLVPDSIWLSVLEIDGKTITIAGRGNEVSGVIETLESSDTFSAVYFASATQRETDAATDSFSISAVVDANGPEQ